MAREELKWQNIDAALNATYRAIAQDRRLRNFDIFDFALNGTA